MNFTITTVIPDPNGTWTVEEFLVDKYVVRDNGVLRTTINGRTHTFSPTHWYRITENDPE